jgi:OOP family OmpA-OmpF porin
MKSLWKFLVVLPLLSQGQGNLIPNGGFENLTECPWGINQLQLASPWVNTGGDDTPDLFNVCAIPNQFPPYNNSAGVPQNAIGSQQPHSGEGYCGLFAMSDPEQYPDSREYIQVKLLDTIASYHDYLVSFHISLADRFQYALGSIGAFFSDSMISRESLQVLDVVPQIQSPTGIIYDDKENWMEVRDTFNSRFGGESWIVIGNFLPDSLSLITFVDSGAGYNYDRSYYYIDDVSVIALDTPSGVVETEKLLFRIYPNPATEVVQIKGEGLTRVRLLDMSGREVLRSSLLTTTEVNIGHLSLGLYLLEVTDKEGRKAVQKLVVE